jgi:hypothetical protein
MFVLTGVVVHVGDGSSVSINDGIFTLLHVMQQLCVDGDVWHATCHVERISLPSIIRILILSSIFELDRSVRNLKP